jgi:hypothetical protein
MSPRHAANSALLAADARNRALRSFVQGLGIDLLVAVAVVVQGVASSNGPILWPVVVASLGRSVAQAAAAYIMRRFLDRSKIPTPLPPDPPGKPSEDADRGSADLRSLLILIVGVFVGLLLVAIFGQHLYVR